MKNIVFNIMVSLMLILTVEFITPAGKYNKQIKSAVSIVFMCMILFPVFQLLTGKSAGLFFAQNQLQLNTNTVEENQIVEKNNTVVSNTLIKDYKFKLQEALLAEFKKNGIHYSGTVEFDINEDASNETFGAIKSIHLYCEGETNPLSLKKVIKDFYYMDESNIYITEVLSGDAHEPTR